MQPSPPPPPPLERSNLIRSYSSISRSLFKTYESSLDSLIPISEAFDWLAIKRISSLLGGRVFIFKCKICKPFFLKILHLELPCALQQPEILHSEGTVGSPQLWNGRVLKRILLLVMVVGPRLTIMSLNSNKINLKNESYLCNRMFARANLKKYSVLNLGSLRCLSRKKLYFWRYYQTFLFRLLAFSC